MFSVISSHYTSTERSNKSTSVVCWSAFLDTLYDQSEIDSEDNTKWGHLNKIKDTDFIQGRHLQAPNTFPGDSSPRGEVEPGDRAKGDQWGAEGVDQHGLPRPHVDGQGDGVHHHCLQILRDRAQGGDHISQCKISYTTYKVSQKKVEFNTCNSSSKSHFFGGHLV